MTLDSLLIRGRNNLDFMRLAAAVAVVVSHAFPLSQGDAFQRLHEPLLRVTGGAMSIGNVAVAVFFIISGFLIPASWERSRAPWAFLRARFLRIYPALLVVVALAALVLGPLVTTLPVRDYFASTQVGSYFSALALVDVNRPLPGVFVGNTHSDLVNGSLWTLFYEFACYLLVLALGWTRTLRREVVLLLLAVALLLQLLITRGAWLWFADLTVWRELWTSFHFRNLATFGGYFLGGAVAYMYRREIKLTWAGFALASASVMTTFAYGHGMTQMFALAGAYAVLFLGALPGRLNAWGSWGDFSYGTYIYAWPVQQTIVHLHGGSTPVWLNVALAVPITLVLGVASWHLVERRALALRRSSAAIATVPVNVVQPPG